MDKKSSMVLFGLFPGVYLILAFLYIIFVIQPTLCFHHTQPPFIVSLGFWGQYFEYPGGFSELVANFFVQSFYNKIAGPMVFFSIALGIMWLVYTLMSVICPGKLNIIWALAPLTLTIVLANNYNFPFSVIISVAVVLLLLLLLAKKGINLISTLIFYIAGAVIVYYLCGSGYMLLFSACTILLPGNLKLWARLTLTGFILLFGYLFPLVAYNFLFAIAPADKYLYLFPPKMYFMAYIPNRIFYIYLLSVPVLLAFSEIVAQFQKNRKSLVQNDNHLKLITSFGFAVILIMVFTSHQATFRADGKKIVASDYYCYNNNAEKTRIAATSLQDYSFIANLNYNLAISKAGRLTDDFFDFFQIAGTDALYPDNEFLAERSFLAADFYYHLGYISEARHWAYESLVFYPYSLRAMQILVKIHLITREYKAAEKYLNILNRGLTGRDFVHTYSPYLKDTSLTNTNIEIVEKRSFIPEEHELSPYIQIRFQELLESNKKNRNAYEFLMLYYLLDSQPEKFLELYKDAATYFSRPVEIYEEAILMYSDSIKIPGKTNYKVSSGTTARFKDFKQMLDHYKWNEMAAMNALYPRFGKSYMYYLRFIYPRIIKPEIISEDDEKPSI